MMHHNSHSLRSFHSRSNTVNILPSFPSANNENLVQKNLLPSGDRGSSKSLKTPGKKGLSQQQQQQQPQQRRAFGDISNRTKSNGNNNGSLKGDGFSTTATKPLSKPFKTPLKSTQQTPGNRKHRTTATTPVLPPTKPLAPLAGNGAFKTTLPKPVASKKVNFQLPPGGTQTTNIAKPKATNTVYSFDSIERPAGRTWAEQEPWESELSPADLELPPEFRNMGQQTTEILVNRRRQRDREQQEREDLGWALWEQEFAEVARQDELDVQALTPLDDLPPVLTAEDFTLPYDDDDYEDHTKMILDMSF